MHLLLSQNGGTVLSVADTPWNSTSTTTLASTAGANYYPLAINDSDHAFAFGGSSGIQYFAGGNVGNLLDLIPQAYRPQVTFYGAMLSNGTAALFSGQNLEGTPATGGKWVARNFITDTTTGPTANGTWPLAVMQYPSTGWTNVNPAVINSSGTILGTAIALDANGNPVRDPIGNQVTHAVLLIPVKVTWETYVQPAGTSPNTPIDDNNDPVIHPPMSTYQPMPGGGKRIYPDKKNPTDTGTGRNKVTLRVDTGGTGAGWKVYVQAFDIDDPTPDSVDVDYSNHHHVIDTNDTDTVKKGNDNLSDPSSTPQTGFFTHSGTASDNATLDSTGKADFEFNVGYQPGNNYRVAVTFFKADDLSNLQVTDSTQPGYMPPEADKTPSGFSGAVSPPLTVWRRLWIEQDSMEAVPTTGDQMNFLTGNITAIARDTPVTGQSTVTTDTLFWDDANRFEDGTITINGTPYTVISNTNNEPNRYYPDQVVITGTPSDAAVIGKSFTIVDDDEQFLPTGWSPLLPRFNLVTDYVKSLYSPAYILVMDASAYNGAPANTIPFVLNEDIRNLLTWPNITSNEGLTTSATCWTHLLVACYQPGKYEDADPDTETPLSGATIKFPGVQAFSAIFLEAVRENRVGSLAASGSRSMAQAQFILDVQGITAHEIGHTPANNADDHTEMGLMDANVPLGSHFLAPTILRFRQSQTWNKD